jgi:hypothetical protein
MEVNNMNVGKLKGPEKMFQMMAKCELREGEGGSTVFGNMLYITFID